MLKFTLTPQIRKIYNASTLRDKALAGFVVAGLIGLGIYNQVGSHAATDSIVLNAAEGTLSAGAAIINDITAASGRAVNFVSGSNGGTATLAAFPKQASTIATFLAPGVKPPTNQWFSNMAFQEPSNPVFAYPMALQTMPTGFGVMFPKVVSTTNTAFGSYSHDLLADMGAVNTRVLSYDDISVSLEALNSAGTQVATYRLTQGSPIVYVTLKAGNHLTMSGPNTPVVTAHTGYYDLVVSGKTYELAYNSAATGTNTGSSVTLNAAGDAQIAIGILPADSTDVAGFIAEMQDPITGTVVGYGAGATTVSTSFTINTKANNGSLLALVPAQQSGTAPGAVLGTYTTLMGTMKLYKISNYNFTTNSAAPPTALDISKMTAAQKTEVIAALTTDINNLTPNSGFSANDTYFGGKQLARAANMLSLAQLLGQPALAQQAYTALDGQMTQWLNPDNSGRSTHYFYYDTNLKGLVGVTPSFGSDTEFNDHHFHYGYFLYAAGIMAAYKPAFATTHAEIINSLVRDIADTDRSDPYFPYLRAFDQYSGHSWASGTSPFADGNNNESSSEAVNAWYGLYLWARSSGNTAMETQARWMYGRESDAALTYWTNFDRSQPQFSAYTHSVVSMVWGGKMDYGTWFSPSSWAKLGIQVLPVTPGSAYLGRDPARVATNIANLPDGSTPAFLDVMAMYKSFSNPSGAISDAKALPDTGLDDGNSRSWFMAWVYSH